MPMMGVPSTTLRPSDPSGYIVYEKVYVNNTSAASLTVSDLGADFSAVLTDDAPQVLIVHTHGCEAYTMPEGEEYIETLSGPVHADCAEGMTLSELMEAFGETIRTAEKE